MHSATQPIHCLFEHFKIEIKANLCHLPCLGLAKDVAGTPQTQILHGHLEAGAKEVHVLQNAQPFLCNARHVACVRHNKIGIGLTVASANAPPQLIELTQAKVLRLIDYQGVGSWKIKARFDDGGAHKDVQKAVPELAHGIVHVLFRHLPVHHGNARARHKPFHIGLHPLKTLHAVVDPEYLPLAGNLPLKHGTQGLVVSFEHGSGYGLALPWRCLNKGKIAYAGHGKLQCPWDGRGSECQHIHVLLHLLKAFLVAHPEALLLVQDEQA